MLSIFRRLAKVEEITSDEKDWVGGVIAERSCENSYIRTTVRREMRILQLEIPNIPSGPIQKIWRVLVGNGTEGRLDNELVMYI
jgi:hypothetical protein